MYKTLHKIRSWWIGELNPDPKIYETGSVEDIFSDESNYLKRPFVRRILSTICQFWLNRWPILLPIIVATIVALFIHFDSKANGEPKQKENSTKTTHDISNIKS